MHGENSGLRKEMQDRFGEVREELQNAFGQLREELREVRAIQDAHGKVMSQLLEGVESISRKLARLGEVLR